MKPVVGALRHMGIRLVIYLDDILVMHQQAHSKLLFTGTANNKSESTLCSFAHVLIYAHIIVYKV